MMRFIPTADERGSMPLALLATFMIAALVVVLIATVIVGQRSTRFDARFENALQTAEVGLDQLQFLAESGGLGNVTEYGPFEYTTDEGTYVVYADKSSGDWYLESTGTVNGVTRTVTRGTVGSSVWQVAAFARDHFRMVGANRIDSYESGTWEGEGESRTFNKIENGSNICASKGGRTYSDVTGGGQDGTIMCNQVPGWGIGATNGRMDILGNVSNYIEGIHIHFSREIENPMAGATGHCFQTKQNCQLELVEHFRAPLNLPMYQPPPELDNAGPFPGDPNGDFAKEHGYNVLPAGDVLFTDIEVTKETVIKGTPDNPTVVWFTGHLNVPSKEYVNFEGTGTVHGGGSNPNGKPRPRPAPSLQMFAIGAAPVFNFGGDINIAGAIYAPNAVVYSNAQGDIFGAMVAGTLDTQGGWGFHFDKALLLAGTPAPPKVTEWNEIPSSEAVGPTKLDG